MKIEVDEIMTELPQTPREALALAMIAARERRVTETHNDVLPIYLFGFDDATEAALEAIAALPRCSDDCESDPLQKPQYIIEGIILRRLHEKRIEGYTIEMAKEIADALAVSRPQPSDETAGAFGRLFPDYKQAGFTGGQAADFEILKRALSLSRPLRGTP